MDIEAIGDLGSEGTAFLVVAAVFVAVGVLWLGLWWFGRRDPKADEALDAAYRLRFGAGRPGVKPGAKSVMSADLHDVEPTPNDEREIPFGAKEKAELAVRVEKLAAELAGLDLAPADVDETDEQPSEWALRTLAAIREAAALPYHLPAADREPKHLRASAVLADEAMHSGMTGFTLRLTDDVLADLDAQRAVVAA